MKRIMSIDQSSRVTGWAIYDNERLTEWGHFSIPANKTIGQRLKSFHQHLIELLDFYNVEQLYFEGIQLQNGNAETYKKLAMIQGMVFFTCDIKQVPCTELMPSHWRKIIGEKHNWKFGRSRAEQKQKAAEFVKKQFNVCPTEDECDAICLGLAGIYEEKSHKSAF